ncbi:MULTISPECIES: hypothetical protein [unclassified Bradyrhizobium]
MKAMKDFIAAGGDPHQMMEIAREIGCYRHVEPFTRLAEEMQSAFPGDLRETEQRVDRERLAQARHFARVPDALLPRRPPTNRKPGEWHTVVAIMAS